MAVMDRVKGGLKSAAGSTWTLTKKLLIRVAVAGAILAVAVVLARAGESSASDSTGVEPAGVSGTDAHPIAAQRAILTEGWTHEQVLSCTYEVQAAFGVSVFTETRMGARRLVRVPNHTEVHGACDSVEGGRTIGCAGLSWETDWIRVQYGDAVGFSPASCLVDREVL